MNKLKTLLFSIIIALAVATIAFAWTSPSANPPSGGGALYYSGSNVGIGTASPGAKLDVSGLIRNSAPSQGTIELSGLLPGYSDNTYPTLKTSGATLYFSANGVYSGYWSGNSFVSQGNVTALGQFNGSGAGLTGTASSLTVGTATQASYLNTTGLYYQGGNVGIGTATMNAKLQFDNSYDAAGPFNAYSDYKIIFYDSGTVSGSFGIGMLPDTLAFHSANKIEFYSGASATPNVLINNSGIKSSAGTFISGQRSNFFLYLQSDRNMVLYDGGVAVWSSGSHESDIRLKKNINTLDGVLDKIATLRAVSFNWKDDEFNDPEKEPEIGLIAQELEEVFPQFVYTDPSSGYKLIYYDKLSSVLIQAVKELKEENDALKERIEVLEIKSNPD